MFQFHKLSNGLKLYTRYISNSKIVKYIHHVGIGSKDDTIYGIAHAAEHAIFNFVGSSFGNAATSLGYTHYYMVTHKDDFKKFFDGLIERFINGVSNVPINVIVKEIQSERETVSHKSTFTAILDAAGCKSIIGNEESIDKFTTDNINEFIKTRYSADNMVVVIESGIPDIFDILEDQLEEIPILKYKFVNTIDYQLDHSIVVGRIDDSMESFVTNPKNMGPAIITLYNKSYTLKTIGILADMLLYPGSISTSLDLHIEKHGIGYDELLLIYSISDDPVNILTQVLTYIKNFKFPIQFMKDIIRSDEIHRLANNKRQDEPFSIDFYLQFSCYANRHEIETFEDYLKMLYVASEDDFKFDRTLNFMIGYSGKLDRTKDVKITLDKVEYQILDTVININSDNPVKYKLPQKNKYLDGNILPLATDPSSFEIIYEDEFSSVYHVPNDNSFITVTINISDTPLSNYEMNTLHAYLVILGSKLSSTEYYVSQANMHRELLMVATGPRFKIYGQTDSILDLMEDLVRDFINLNPNKEDFEKAKSDSIFWIPGMPQPTWFLLDKFYYDIPITFQDVKNFRINSVKMEGFYSCTIPKEHIIKHWPIKTLIGDRQFQKISFVYGVTIDLLPIGYSYLSGKSDNNVLSSSYQIPSPTYADFIYLHILDRLLYDEHFTFMRTKNKLGYIASCRTFMLHGFFEFVVISSKFSSEYMLRKHKQFIKMVPKFLQGLSEETYISELSHVDDYLFSYYTVYSSGSYNYNIAESTRNAKSQISKTSIIQFFKHHFIMVPRAMIGMYGPSRKRLHDISLPLNTQKYSPKIP